MTPQAEPDVAAATEKIVRCQHCYCNIINVRGHWIDGKTRAENCLPISTGATVVHKPLPKV